MRKRILNALLGVFSLVIGLGIYVFFKPNAYVSRLFGFAPVIQIREFLLPYSCDFVRYYLSDYLWGFAFCCGLAVIFQPKGRDLWLCGLAGVAFGFAWELCQWTGIAGGTGDFWDIIMYLLAAGAVIFINNIKKEKTK